MPLPIDTTLDVAIPFKRVSTADTNAAVIKTSAGWLASVHATNTNATARYLKLYNKATAPTVGTDVPVHTLLIPASAAAPLQFNPAIAERFTAGIAMALTVENTDVGSTGVAAGDILVNVAYV
jgi:hypothetical protein